MFVYMAKSECGQIYIGASTRSLKTRITEHNCHANTTRKTGKFYDLIRKNGINYFSFKILKRCKSLSALDFNEKLFISKYDSYMNGLNGSLGGKENRKTVFSEKFLKSAKRTGKNKLLNGQMKKMWETSHTSENQRAKSKIHHEKNRLRMPTYEAIDLNTGIVVGKFQGYKDASKNFGCSGQALRSRVLRGSYRNFIFNFVEVTNGN